MTRHGLPAATTPRGTSPITTLPAPMTDPFPITDPFKTIDRAPTKTSSSMAILSSSCGSDSGAYLRGTVSTGWKSVSATTTSAPRRTRSPIAMNVAAQIEAPLIPTSEPIRIVAPGRRVRSTTRLETPRAVRDDREMSRLLDPIDILESRSRPTIGHPSKVTAFPISTPKYRSRNLQIADRTWSSKPRSGWIGIRRSLRCRASGFISANPSAKVLSAR